MIEWQKCKGGLTSKPTGMGEQLGFSTGIFVINRDKKDLLLTVNTKEVAFTWRFGDAKDVKPLWRFAEAVVQVYGLYSQIKGMVSEVRNLHVTNPLEFFKAWREQVLEEHVAKLSMNKIGS